MASEEHSEVQAPQSMQASLSTTALLSTREMQPTGQISTHDPHPVHLEVFTTAGI